MVTNTSASSIERESTFVMPVEHRISWGALFAGLSIFLAIGWLLLMLGSALGVSIADATDLEAVGNGLGIASIIWVLLSTLAATFFGAYLTASVAGSPTKRIGAMHGLVLWSVATIAVLLLGATSIGGTVNAISGIVSSGSEIGGAVLKTATNSGDDSDSMLPDAVTTSVTAVLKRQASKLISTTATGANSPKSGEVRKAIETLNARDAGAIASALISGDIESARQRLENRTNLSGQQIDSIISGAQDQMEQWQMSDASVEAQAWLNEQLTQAQQAFSESVSDIAGSEVTSGEINEALKQLDPEILTETARHLVMGNTEQAKDVLIVNTNLSERDVDAIVDGAQQEVQKVIDNAKEKLAETTEAIGNYTQATLWTAFVTSALGVLAGIFGGLAGAGNVRKTYKVISP